MGFDLTPVPSPALPLRFSQPTRIAGPQEISR